MTDKKQLLKEFLKDKEIPLFYQEIWLDTVCGEDGWEVILSQEGNGPIRAFMPIHQRRKFGISAIIAPKLTPYGGILYFPPPNMNKRLSLYSFKKKCSHEIIDQLPKVTYFNVAMYPDFTDSQPFTWEGYSQKSRYTYRIPANETIENVWNEMDAKTRNDITSGQQILKVRASEDFELFHKINEYSFKKQNVQMVYDRTFLQKIYQQINTHRAGSAQLLLAFNESEAVAGIFVVADGLSMYYMASGKIPDAPRGAVSLLIWEAIQDALSKQLAFDFEGSDMPKVESFFRSFGGIQTSYIQIFKASNKFFDLSFRAIGKL